MPVAEEFCTRNVLNRRSTTASRETGRSPRGTCTAAVRRDAPFAHRDPCKPAHPSCGGAPVPVAEKFCTRNMSNRRRPLRSRVRGAKPPFSSRERGKEGQRGCSNRMPIMSTPSALPPPPPSLWCAIEFTSPSPRGADWSTMVVWVSVGADRRGPRPTPWAASLSAGVSTGAA